MTSPDETAHGAVVDAAAEVATANPSQRVRLQEPLDTQVEQAIGEGMAWMLLQPGRWVHRRVEFIRFIDEQTALRQTSVDFTLPVRYRSVAETLSLTSAAPLATLRKENLRRFSVWDEDRRPVPLLTTVENGRVAGALLVAIASRLTAKEGQDLPAEVADVLRFVAAAPAPTARFVLHEMSDEPSRLARGLRPLRGLLAAHPELGATSESLDLLIALTPQADVVKTLLSNRLVHTLLSDFANQFLMLVLLSGDLSARRVIKFDFEDQIHSSGRARSVRRRLDATLESLGWKAKPFDFDRIAAGTAESYHVEVVAPDQLEFTEARIMAVEPSTGKRWTDVAPRPAATERIHLHVRVDGSRGHTVLGRVEVRFRSALLGLPLMATAITVFIAAVLLAGWSRVSLIDKGAGTALLLVGPTLLAALVARPGEHALATRLLFGLRVLVILSGVCSFVAGAALAAKYGGKLGPIWAGATVAACAFAGVALMGLLIRPGGLTSRCGTRIKSLMSP